MAYFSSSTAATMQWCFCLFWEGPEIVLPGSVFYRLSPCVTRSTTKAAMRQLQLWDSCQRPLSKMERFCSAKHKSCKVVGSDQLTQEEPGLCCVWEDVAFLVVGRKFHAFTWEPPFSCQSNHCWNSSGNVPKVSFQAVLFIWPMWEQMSTAKAGAREVQYNFGCAVQKGEAEKL